ncbi:MAG: LPS-assembly protein LptD [Herminiimonas sp.]|nr:LPS-assembly protein LptD [Herminiimonas sp.]
MQGAARAVLPSRHTATALGAAEFPYNKGFISKNRLQISIHGLRHLLFMTRSATIFGRVGHIPNKNFRDNLVARTMLGALVAAAMASMPAVAHAQNQPGDTAERTGSGASAAGAGTTAPAGNAPGTAAPTGTAPTGTASSDTTFQSAPTTTSAQGTSAQSPATSAPSTSAPGMAPVTGAAEAPPASNAVSAPAIGSMGVPTPPTGPASIPIPPPSGVPPGVPPSGAIAPKPGGAADKNGPTSVSAERMTGRPDRDIVLEREVEIIRGANVINADRATYDIVNDEVEAVGNVRMKRFNDRYTGDDLKLKMDTGVGYVDNPTYRMDTSRAQGKAERVDFEGDDRTRVQRGTYSTCEGPDPDWYLKSSVLNIDKASGTGTASNAIVIFKGVPILGSPYMSFPLSTERKSGVLPPTFGTTNKGGLELMVPYYFNIAPNRDLTLYPKIISQRGVQIGADGRYLGQGYAGETKVEGLLNDRLSGTNRYAISSSHNQSLGSGFSFSSKINLASDDNYPNDFPSTITAASQRLLENDVALSYSSGSFWSASAHASKYQILQDPAAPIARPYDRLPQATLLAGRTTDKGITWSVASEFTRFWHPDLVRGDRSVVNPRVSYPIIKPGYFITPSFSVHATNYMLDNQVPGAPNTLNRVLPTASLDTGLIFERDAKFLGKEGTQTLEPRLFYVYTPYRDQSQFPNFDTALADFNFSQVFAENRFSGNDRISDANQLTAAVTSRFIESNGVERMRFALAQRFYFNDQLVTNGAPIETKSDLLAAASGQITTNFSIDTSVQYSQSLRTFQRAVYGVRWQPAPKKILNVQYRKDVPTALELIDASGQWPIGGRWYAVGRVNYSLLEKKLAEGLGGVEYKADCWIFRAVVQRIPTAAGVVASALFLQLELSGLSKFGSNPMQALRTYVPGYQPITNSP